MQLRSAALLLLLSPVAVGQTASPSSPKTPQRRAPAAQAAKPATGENTSVAPDAPVITITETCENPGTQAKSGSECKTIVTRAQFERLANALQPNMPANTQRRLADAYPKIVLMAHAAHKRGLENDPSFKEMMQFLKLQVLAQELSRTLKDEADKVPEADIQSFYNTNADNFEQASLQRLFIPKDKQAGPAIQADGESADTKGGEAQQAGEEAMKKEAEALHGRAAAGEDFDKLQKEAYEAAGLQGSPPSTALGRLTRNELPANHRSVIDLAAGQVSPLLTEPNGYYVYKLTAKDVRPLNEAREQIRMTLAQQRLQAAMERVQSSGKTELNEAYFPAAPPAPAMRPGMAPAPPGMAAPPSKSPATDKKSDSTQQPPK